MAKKLTGTTSVAAITDALTGEAAACFAALARKYGKERPYAFVLEVSATGYGVGAALATEDGLLRFAEECKGDYGDDLARAAADCRWAGPENGWHQTAERAFRETNRLLHIADATALYPAYDGTLERAAVDVFRALDDRHAFGEGASREALVVGVCHTGGDNTDRQFLAWAELLNPKPVCDRLARELEERR